MKQNNLEKNQRRPDPDQSPPPRVLSFENVTVHVNGSKGVFGKFVLDPAKTFLREYLAQSVEHHEPFDCCEDLSGYLRVGETCLVLGPERSGRSSLLKALSGRLTGDMEDVHGSIHIDGVQLDTKSGELRAFTAYVPDNDDIHSPVLTVRETFEFAASLTNNEAFVGRKVDEMLEMLDLVHVADTVIGDAKLRGLSGGQKRRVTVGEALFKKSTPFFFLDNITNGLDAITSQALVGSVQSICRETEVAAMITLQQASREIILSFDKVLVLSGDGGLAYFGPAEENSLNKFFGEGKGHTLASRIVSVCSDGASFNPTVKFKTSSEYKHLGNQLSSYSNVYSGTVLAEKTCIAASNLKQFKLICGRKLKLISRNPMTYARVAIGIVFAVVVGSLFCNVGGDFLGSLGTAGFMFLSVFLILMLSAAVTFPETFRNRASFHNHRNLDFYHPYVYYISQVVMDVPLSFLEALLISTIPYFWVGLAPTPGAYFYYFFVLFGVECCGQAFSRLVCGLTPTAVFANICISIVLTVCGALCGYMPTYNQIGWWLRWITWVTPVSYAYEGIMLNEFTRKNISGIDMSTFGLDIEVAGVNIGDMSLLEFPGTVYTSANSLPRIQWGSDKAIMALDIVVLYMFAIVFDLVGLLTSEVARKWYSLKVRRPIFNVSSSPLGSKIVKTRCRTIFDVESGRESHDVPTQVDTPVLSLRNLSYTIPASSSLNPVKKMLGLGNRLRLLERIDTQFLPGRMTALMGSSGAGKTTLLDVIAGYKTSGQITGAIYLNGKQKQASTWKKISGYAEQKDSLNPYLSVEETLIFSAKCRLPTGADVDAVVVGAIEVMGLTKHAGHAIGREGVDEGLTTEIRRRVTIAVELVAQPLILFLDEPLNGLSARAAQDLIGCLRRVTDEMNIVLIATVHQPSREIFESFNDLLLLTKGGVLGYAGPIGQKSADVVKFFEANSTLKNMVNRNPAEYILGAVQHLSCGFKDTCEYRAMIVELDSIEQGGYGDVEQIVESQSYASFFDRYTLLVKRQFLAEWRNPRFSAMRLMLSLFGGILLGLLFFGQGGTLFGAVFTIAAIFHAVFLFVIPMQAVVVPLMEDREVMFRETCSGTYSKFAYGLATLTGNVPFHLANSLVFFIPFYFLVGLRSGPAYAGYFLLMLVLVNWLFVSLGQLFAYVSPNVETANGLAGFAMIVSVLLCGFIITVRAMPSYWQWGYECNMLHYALQGFVTNEIAGQEYFLNVSGMLGVSPPDNLTDVVPAPLVDGVGDLMNMDISIFSNAPSLSQFLKVVVSLMESFQSGGVVGLIEGLQCEKPRFGDPNNCAPLQTVQCFVEDPSKISKLMDCLQDGVLGVIKECAFLCGIASSTGALVNAATCLSESSSIGRLLTQENTATAKPAGLSATIGPDMSKLDKIEELSQTVNCLAKALLPVSYYIFIEETLSVIVKLVLVILQQILDALVPFGHSIVDILVNILNNGLYLDGNMLLLFFGWGNLDNSYVISNLFDEINDILAESRMRPGVLPVSFALPVSIVDLLMRISRLDFSPLGELSIDTSFKWYYCMFAVGMFLLGIELLKLLALQLFTWIRR